MIRKCYLLLMVNWHCYLSVPAHSDPTLLITPSPNHSCCLLTLLKNWSVFKLTMDTMLEQSIQDYTLYVHI